MCEGISVLFGNIKIYDIYSARVVLSANKDIEGFDIPINKVV